MGQRQTGSPVVPSIGEAIRERFPVLRTAPDAIIGAILQQRRDIGSPRPKFSRIGEAIRVTQTKDTAIPHPPKPPSHQAPQSIIGASMGRMSEKRVSISLTRRGN